MNNHWEFVYKLIRNTLIITAISVITFWDAGLLTYQIARHLIAFNAVYALTEISSYLKIPSNQKKAVKMLFF